MQCVVASKLIVKHIIILIAYHLLVIITAISILQIEEVADSNLNTDDGAHYYDELPCNLKKDAHTGENAYHGEEDPSSVC